MAQGSETKSCSPAPRERRQGQPISGRFVNAIKLEQLLNAKFGNDYFVEVCIAPFTIFFYFLHVSNCYQMRFDNFTLFADEPLSDAEISKCYRWF